MASKDYCSSASTELRVLLGKLQKLSAKIDHIPSIDKYKMSPQIQELNMIITEVDDRINEMINSCSTVERPHKVGVADSSLAPNAKLQMNTNEFFDYEFGG
jgi:hypothetical protein